VSTADKYSNTARKKTRNSAIAEKHRDACRGHHQIWYHSIC